MVTQPSLRIGTEISIGTSDFDTKNERPCSLPPSKVLSFPDAQAEEYRIEGLKAEDPIAWQDCYMSSFALRRACDDRSVDDVKEILAAAQPGDFVPSLTQSIFISVCVERLDAEIAAILVRYGGLSLKRLPGSENLVHRVCERVTRENFSEVKHVLQMLVVDCSVDINSYCTLEEKSRMFGFTALALAVQQRKPPLVFELLALGADPNRGHKDGRTALGVLWGTGPYSANDKEAAVILENLLKAKGGKLKLSLDDEDTSCNGGLSSYRRTPTHTSYRN